MKNYPELHICKKDDASGEWISVFKSDVMKNQDAGQWDPISIPCKSVCGENYNKKIRLYVYNDQKETLQDKREVVKNFYKIGYAEATVNQIQSMRNEILTLKPCNPKVARAGNLIIRSASLFEKLTFFGQIMKGLRFNLACAISFASSNRPPRDSKSLHYTPFGQSNAYQATMGAIGGAIEPYSDGRPFHAWGLAAKYNRILSHCFPLTINGNKDLAGLRDLQNAYYGIFENIVFDKPVSIVPSTRQAISLVAGSKNPADYLVFVIMVNEVPVDLDEFIDLLYDNQMEPISVVVVGIGDDEFKEMGTKLSPGMLKNSKEMVFDRDVALFIKFNDYGMQALDQFMSTALITVTDQAVHWVDVNVNFV